MRSETMILCEPIFICSDSIASQEEETKSYQKHKATKNIEDPEFKFNGTVIIKEIKILTNSGI